MNKLGFAIKVASQGAVNAIECNKGQWTNKVVDIREYLKLFNCLQGTDNTVTFIKFDEGGCFLTQLRAISGRGGDFLSGWIYIPNTIEVTGDDILNAYKYVRDILSLSNINESKVLIDAFFSKEYPSKEYVAPYLPSQGDKFGVRFLGLYTMKEILDDNRYQSYYSTCKAIFLMDKSGEVSITKEAAMNMFLDYTKSEIVKSAVLIPPSSDSLQNLGKGTKIVTTSGAEFKEPMFVNFGTKQEIILKREGFENRRYEVPIQKEIVNLDGSQLQGVWRKCISSTMFIVRNRNNEPIQIGLNINVNDQDITYKEILVPEDECHNAIVKISATDFESFESRENLLRSEISITLKRKNKTFHSRIEMANGKVAEITLESKHIESLDKSPLKGYDFDDDFRSEKCLRMSYGFLLKQRLYGFLVALVIGFSVLAIDSWLDIGLLPCEMATEVVEDSLSKKNAIKYLNENTDWNKTEMEKYPILKGLYDDMNNFKLQAIIDDWFGKLDSSKYITKIKEAAKKNTKNGWDPKQKEHDPTYNSDNDTLINVLNYIKWLNEDQTKPDLASPTDPKEKAKKKTSDKSPESVKKQIKSDTNSGSTNSKKDNNAGL
jgi:hypothetical protein